MSEVICQLFGYFLQTFPILFLMFVLIPDECWKKPASYMRIRLLAINIIMGLVFVAVLFGFCGNMTSESMVQLIANIVMLAAIVIIFTDYLRSICLNAAVKLLFVIMYLHYEAVVVTINTFIIFSLKKYGILQAFIWPYHPWNLAGMLLIYVVTLPFIYGFIRRNVRTVISAMETETAVHGIIFTSIALAVFCVCAFLFNISFMEIKGFIFLLGLIISNVIVYYFFYSEIYFIKKQEEGKKQIQLAQMQYQALVKNIEETRRIRHDMHHHLNMMSILLKEEKYEELARYLKDSQIAYDLANTQIYSKNIIIDSILKYYISKAKMYKIKMSAQIDVDETEVEKTDLVIILGNCLENAIEACLKVKDNQEIDIKMAIIRQMLLIQVKNTCVDRADSISEFADYRMFASTKGGGEGLKSIHAAAVKYGGSALFRQSDGCFTARIMLKNIK